MKQVRVNPKAVDRLRSGHPWIFSSDVLDRGGAAPGEAVTVAGPRGQILGTAHHSSTSQIALRMLAARRVEPDAAFFRERIQAAQRLRDLVVHDTDAYRLVHSEADLLPGLVVDRYGDCLAVQFLSQGMDAGAATVTDVLEELYAPRAIVARNDAPARSLESLPRHKTVLRGSYEGPSQIRMNGLVWHADLLEGQKTGVFLDQRQNYPAAASYLRPGARVLDCYTSSGGFALHAARAGAAHVDALDSSAPALDLARRNAEANGLTGIEFRQADVPALLQAYATSRRRYDMVVLDPPAFAKARNAVEGARRGYHEINLRALKLLEAGGILVTCSCSHHFSEAMLAEVAAQASLEAGRTVRVLERRVQSQDHPVLLTVPETLYLKIQILQIV